MSVRSMGWSFVSMAEPTPSSMTRRVLLEEIKTPTALTLLSDQPEQSGYNPLHWAQATCYAFILAQQRQLPEVRVRLIYCQLETEETISFAHRLSFEQLSRFYLDLLARYHRWAMMRFDSGDSCATDVLNSLPSLSEYRAGQRQMAAVIYRTAKTAPVSSVKLPPASAKPSLPSFRPSRRWAKQALPHFLSDRKNSTRLAAEEAFARCRKKDCGCAGEPDRQGPHLLSARAAVQPRRLSPMPKATTTGCRACCCEMLKQEDAFTRPVIERWAKQRQLCPFELELDLSLWCDAVICDYNYLFDPIVTCADFLTTGTAMPS